MWLCGGESVLTETELTSYPSENSAPRLEWCHACLMKSFLVELMMGMEYGIHKILKLRVIIHYKVMHVKSN